MITDRRIQSCQVGEVGHYEAQVVSISDYYPFGMGIQDRQWKDSSFSYRFGFNGMEQDNEVSGDGVVYSTEFRLMDTRLGRWFSTDPVLHEFFSPYNCFDNCPILIKDPSGADGEIDEETGEANATIYVRFDGDSELDCEAQNEYIENMKKSIMDNYNGVSLPNGNKIDASTVRIVHAPEDMVEGDLGVNDNLIIAGNGSSDDNQFTYDNTLSHMSGKRNSIGYFYLKNNGSEAAHEFGHMLGLSDRYTEAVSPSGNLLSPRETVPLMINDRGYSPTANLMSNDLGGVGNFTNRQMKIMMNRNKFERKYTTAVVVIDDDFVESGAQSVRVRRMMGLTILNPYNSDGKIKNKKINWGWGNSNGGNMKFTYFGSKAFGDGRKARPSDDQRSNSTTIRDITEFLKGE